MEIVWTILKTLWTALLLFGLCVPIIAGCAGTIPKLEGEIQINVRTGQEGEDINSSDNNPME